MDRDYDGRLSFGEFMGEETPLEKVILMNIFNYSYIPQLLAPGWQKLRDRRSPLAQEPLR